MTNHWLDKEMQAGQRAIEFINLLTLTGDYSEQLFQTRPWQDEIISKIFDTLDEKKSCEAMLVLPKKNGKSQLLAGIALYCLCGLEKTGQTIVIAASSREQASVIYDMCAQMVKANPHLTKILDVYKSKKRIVYTANNNVIVAISKESSTAHGLNPSTVLFDELHAQKSKELWGVLRNSMGTRKERLWISITHAGFDRASLGYEQFEYAQKVKEGSIENENYVPILYYSDDKEDWTDREIWKRVNPALGDFLSMDDMEQEFEKAKELPAEQNNWLMFRLNRWVTQAVRWLPMDHWKQCRKIDPKALLGQPCFGGVDLASVSDFSCCCLYFPELCAVLPFFWLPKDSITKRLEYKIWANRKQMKLTSGNTTDYDVIRKDINAFGKVYNIKQIAVDRWNASQLVTQLDGDGFALEYFGQGYRSMNDPSKELERLILNHKLAHNNPVLTWMASNVSIETDAAGNIKPSKKRSTEKIDGIVSLVMAIGISLPKKEEKKIVRKGVVWI